MQNSAANGHDAVKDFSSKFRAVISTDAPSNTHARDNTGTTFTNNDKGVPIYWLNGPKVADNYQDFYDGSWDSNGARNENGDNVGAGTSVWTGTSQSGTRYYAAGPPGDPEQVGGGKPRGSEGLDDGFIYPSNGYRPLYGLSPVLTVVAPTPHKPATPSIGWGPPAAIAARPRASPSPR